MRRAVRPMRRAQRRGGDVLLEARGIDKRYRSRGACFTALRDACLSVDAGEMVGLIGASGSGKSTLASIVVGLETADAGTIELGGASCDASTPVSSRSRAYRRALGDVQMVFQNPAASFSPRMRIGAGVAEGVAYRGVSHRMRASMAADALERVGLARECADKYPWELSGGECQRAAIARAIVGSPKLLVCDEPTSSLDVTTQAHLVSMLARLCDDMGMACLFISHDLALVCSLCSRAYVLDKGRVVEEGAVEALFRRPGTEATKNLIAAARRS